MSESHGDAAGCFLRSVAIGGMTVLAVLVLALGGGYLAADHALRRAERAWAERAEPMESFVARHPPRPDSAAAEALDALTRPLGIRMRGPYEKESEADKERARLLGSLGSFVGDCGRSGHDRCPALPPEAALLLERENARLDAIETHILEGGPLHWEQDIAKGYAAPVPRLLGQRQLQGLLLARALAHDTSGHGDAAERSLEASWRLSASYAERPELISRLVTVAVAQMQNAVFRTLLRPSDRWLERLGPRSFTGDVLVPYQAEAWYLLHLARDAWGAFDLDELESGEPKKRSIAASALRFVSVPYVRLSLARGSEALLEAVEHLRAQPRCDFDLDRYSKDFEASFPRWNVLGRIATPSAVRGFISMRYTDLDTELTAHVLAARAARRATGLWPSAPQPSAVCDGLTWQAQAEGDGSLTISPDAQPFTTDDPRWRWSVRLTP